MSSEIHIALRLSWYNQPMTQRTAQIITFPIQAVPAQDCEYLRDGAFQLKLKFAQILNQVALGRYLLSAENIQGIRTTNDFCRRAGLKPLDFE